jgi:hypothetical protein
MPCSKQQPWNVLVCPCTCRSWARAQPSPVSVQLSRHAQRRSVFAAAPLTSKQSLKATEVPSAPPQILESTVPYAATAPLPCSRVPNSRPPRCETNRLFCDDSTLHVLANQGSTTVLQRLIGWTAEALQGMLCAAQKHNTAARLQLTATQEDLREARQRCSVGRCPSSAYVLKYMPIQCVPKNLKPPLQGGLGWCAMAPPTVHVIHGCNNMMFDTHTTPTCCLRPISETIPLHMILSACHTTCRMRLSPSRKLPSLSVI